MEQTLQPGPPPSTLEVVRLLVSEVVTNAVLHARSEVTIRVLNEGSVVRVEVLDRSETQPVPRDCDDDATTGRGLFLVEQLADDWGTTPSNDGKIVWFEVAAAA